MKLEQEFAAATQLVVERKTEEKRLRGLKKSADPPTQLKLQDDITRVTRLVLEAERAYKDKNDELQICQDENASR